jgi:EAL domain-containing protein (putative c-di-GMP-specific phosphodiesterase class I)
LPLIRHLKLEVTESQVMANPEQAAFVLSNFKTLGLGLALDDFGTGYSSLAYLHRFPFDTIKIAAPFVQLGSDTGFAHTQVPILRAIMSLARELGLKVVAEGVETEEEAERVRHLDCDLAQGYAFDAAMSGSELKVKLAAEQTRHQQAEQQPETQA